MLLNYLTLFIALSISGVAIYYSVAGLASIFAASVIPIIVMGSVLEVGKLVTAVWLHRNWKYAVWWLKAYLSTAVIILMFITSMGIFGFLSKSHIEQAAASDEQTAKINLIDEKITRSNAQLTRWQEEITRISSGSTDNVRVDNLIDRENEALAKIKQQISEEREQIGYEIDGANKSLTKIQKSIRRDKDRLQQQLQSDIDSEERRFAEVRSIHSETMKTLNQQANNCFSCADEQLAIKTEKEEFAIKEENFANIIAKKQEKLQKSVNIIASNYSDQTSKINTRLDQLQVRYDTVADRYKDEIAEVNARISELKEQSNKKTETIEERIVLLEGNIASEQENISQHRVDKSVLESQFRKLEAEVGPVKYIAEFIYDGNADRDTLEEAVRWVIIVIIFVFDPLAVLLLIASQYSFERTREIVPFINDKKEEKNEKTGNKSTSIANVSAKDDTNATDKPKPVAPKKKAISAPRKKVTTKRATKKVETKVPVKKKVAKKKVVKKKAPIKKKAVKKKVAKKKVKAKSHVISDGVRFKYDSPGYMTAGDDKVHNIQAFKELHPEMHLDFESEINFGKQFPDDVIDSMMYMRTDTLPTKLYRFNGSSWDEVDKQLLHSSAYSNAYIIELMNTINDHEYDPILLEALLQEGTDDNQVIVLNNIELQLINEYKG